MSLDSNKLALQEVSNLNEEQKQSLAFMENDVKWGAWPLLPLKKRTDDMPDCGLLMSGKGSVVLLENMFAVHGKYKTFGDLWETAERIEYESFEAIIEDGWVVD